MPGAFDQKSTDGFQEKKMDEFRDEFKKLHKKMEKELPNGRYKSLAQTELEVCAMWVNKSICHETP